MGAGGGGGGVGGGGEAGDLWVRMLCAGAVPVAATCSPMRGRDCVCGISVFPLRVR